jgi:hypothetical protein
MVFFCHYGPVVNQIIITAGLVISALQVDLLTTEIYKIFDTDVSSVLIRNNPPKLSSHRTHEPYIG